MLRVKREESKNLSTGTLSYAKDSKLILETLAKYLTKDVVNALCFAEISSDFVNFYSYYDGSVSLKLIGEDKSIEGVSTLSRSDFYYKLNVIKDYLQDGDNIDKTLIPYRLGLIHLIENANYVAVINDNLISLLPYIKAEDEAKLLSKKEEVVEEKKAPPPPKEPLKISKKGICYFLLLLLLLLLGALLYFLPIKQYIDDFFKDESVVYCNEINDLNRASLTIALDDSLSLHSFDMYCDETHTYISRLDAINNTLFKSVNNIDKRAFLSFATNSEDSYILYNEPFEKISVIQDYLKPSYKLKKVKPMFLEQSLLIMKERFDAERKESKFKRAHKLILIANTDGDLNGDYRKSIVRACELLKELKEYNNNFTLSLIAMGKYSKDYTCIQDNQGSVYSVNSVASLKDAFNKALNDYKKICVDKDGK